MTITTVLFDFDGTLADTLPVCIHSIRRAFLEVDGKHLTDAEVVALFGPTEADIVVRNLVNRQEAERAVRLFYDCYRQYHPVMVKPNGDIIALLERLRERGIRTGIVTGKGRESLRISLKELDMERFFDAAVSGDDMTRPKPDPEGVLKAMELLRASKEETIFVGDSEADMRAGKGAGVFTVGAHWLEHVQTPHFETKPDLYVTSTRQLLELVDERNREF